MEKYFVSFCLVTLLAAGSASAQEPVVSKDGNLRNIDARAVLYDSGEIYLATRNEIYRAVDAKSNWESLFFLPATDNEIICLGGSAHTLYAGTKRGLLRSRDYGKSWMNVFKTLTPEKNNILSIAASPNNVRRVILGTERGIFLSADGGEKWDDISSNLKNRRINCVAAINGSLYACGESGLYVTTGDGAEGWSRLCVRSANTPADDGVVADALTNDEALEEQDLGRMVNCIAYKDKRLYLGIDKYIQYSDDGGKSWSAAPLEGLSGIINYIKVSHRSDKIFCATTKGVFLLDGLGATDGRTPKWKEVYKGKDKIFNARELAYGDNDEKVLWAVTDKGLFRIEEPVEIPDMFVDVELGAKSLQIIYDNEPPFKELQQAAMDFAEVDPDKIAKWRKEARLRALVPKFSTGMDRGRSTNTEIYTSANSKYAVVGPDDINDGWDMSISWELADLIWSDDQTNIDVRSRLTTQLRNDILDDLRRVYFERKRLQFELIANPPKDQKFKYEKELRVQELTQAIDDLTGNHLSSHTKGR